MLLQQLKLHNIRSYQDQTILFPEGSTLLSGDIGSGKSSLLLAIEFALFGTSRPDLPGEALLRKGATSGSVELSFVSEGKHITIKRVLKKEQDTIKQMPGHIIIDNVKQELMPVELKAAMISLLGYPEDTLTKNKNYLFRYTLYTPQEEMKLILLEDADVRLDTLRKVFNIDKYKLVRENIQSYLRILRSRINLLTAAIEPLEQQRQQVQKIQEEKRTLDVSLGGLQQELAMVQELLKLQQERLLLWENQHQEFLELQHRYHTTLLLIRERQEQQNVIVRKQEEVHLALAQLAVPSNIVPSHVRQDVMVLDEKRQVLLQQQAKIQEQRQQLHQRLQEWVSQKTNLQNQAAMLGETESLVLRLEKEAAEKNVLVESKRKLEELFNQAMELITKHETLLLQAKSMHDKIASLDTCPTCLQKVQDEHKHNLLREEQQKMTDAEHIIFEFRKKRSEILQQREQVLHKLEELQQKETLLARKKAEQEQLLEKKALLQQKEEQAAAWSAELERITLSQQQDFSSTIIIQLQQELEQKREMLNQLVKKESFQQQLQQIGLEKTALQQQITQLQQQQYRLEQELLRKKDLSANITELRNVLAQQVRIEKEKSVQQATIATMLQALHKQEEELVRSIENLNHEQQKLIKIRDINHWLEEHFIPLTYTIEKHVMGQIHSLFNQLFQEWFSLLINEEAITARLDDLFTPTIEQNGYEISYPNLSGGEKTSVALAYRLALNKVINDVIPHIKTKNILILDEPTDGFSSEQLDRVREVLDRLNLKQTIIVSHESKIESFVQNVVRIRKEGAESVVS